MKTLGKVVLGLVVILVLAYVVLANFSVVNEHFDCVGTTTKEGKSEEQEFVLRVGLYRWWVSWGDSDGTVWVELPNKRVKWFNTLRVDSIALRFGDDGNVFTAGASEAGRLSTISHVASIFLKDYGVLNGKCVSRENPTGAE